jgi:hypothetical protein
MEQKKRQQEEIDAAVEYGKEHATLGLDYNQVYDAFLAGIDWQKNRYFPPEKEYYGG